MLAVLLLALTAYGAALRAAPNPAPASPSALLGSTASTTGPAPTAGAATPAPTASGAGTEGGAAAPLPFTEPGPEPGEVQTALDAHAIALTESRALAQLPVTELSYALQDVVGDAREVTATATLSYRLRDEPAAVQVPVEVTLTRERDGWQVLDEASTQRPLPWQVGRLAVVTGARTTVIGVGPVPGGRGTLRWWGRTGDRVVREVWRAVGDRTTRLTLVVPPDAATLAQLTGRPADSVSRLAGLALAEPVAAGTGPVVRVYLNPTLLAGASDLARQIVLRHEATHVALHAPATATTPTWLEEGMAEHLGYQGSGVPKSVAVRDLLARLRAGGLPDGPPASAEFSGPHVEVAYQSAHLLVDTMVGQVGLGGTLRVYRLTAADGDLAAAWREVSGTSWRRLLERWQRDLRALAGS